MKNKRFIKYFVEGDPTVEGECGGCVACCAIMGVFSLNKPQYVPCEHQLYQIGDEPKPPGGCGIYSDRPGECADYQCLWRSGCLIPSPSMRPDRIGIILDLASPEMVATVGRPFIHAHECWAGAARDPKARYMLDSLIGRMPYVLVFYGKSGVSIVGPADFKISVARAWMGEENFRLYQMGILPR